MHPETWDDMGVIDEIMQATAKLSGQEDVGIDARRAREALAGGSPGGDLE